MLTYDQMNEIAAYGGFPNRYPHWRFGMEYEQLAKSYEYGLSKIYEMVINNNPSYAYLLEGNSLVDQKLVMAHVYGHVDFFKNNFCFRSTDLDTGGRTVDPVRGAKLRSEPQVDRQDGEPRLARPPPRRAPRHQQGRGVHRSLPLAREPDRSLARPFIGRAPSRDDRTTRSTARVEVPRLAAKDYMESFINPEEYLEEQRKKIEAEKREGEEVPGAARARRAEVPARARAARALGARRPRGHPRGGLLLRPADADEDHERGLGHATGTRG